VQLADAALAYLADREKILLTSMLWLVVVAIAAAPFGFNRSF
jgi:hypothetical protein